MGKVSLWPQHVHLLVVFSESLFCFAPHYRLQPLGKQVRVRESSVQRRQCGLSLVEALDSSAEAKNTFFFLIHRMKAGMCIKVIKIPPAALSVHGVLQGSTTLARVRRTFCLATCKSEGISLRGEVVEGKPDSQKPV